MGHPQHPDRPEVTRFEVPASASPALVAAAEAALAASLKRVLIVEHDGTRYVVKRAAHRRRSLWQSLCLRWLVHRVSGLTLPMHSLRLARASSGVDFEAGRLAALAAAGVRVPRVLRRGDGYLILEHCGISIAALLQRWTPDAWRQELPRLAEQLGDFHQAGQWHGAAQIKNLTRRDGLIYRIDFEEDFGEMVPLAAAQAVDLMLFLNSISLRARIDDAEARGLLIELIDAYFARKPDRQVLQTLARALPLARTLVRLARPLMQVRLRGRPHNGLARLVILVDVLTDYLAQGAAVSEPFGQRSGWHAG